MGRQWVYGLQRGCATISPHTRWRIDIFFSHLAQVRMEEMSWKSFSEAIYKWKASWNVSGNKAACLHMIMDQMAVNLDVLGTLMEDRVGCNVDGDLAVTKESDGLRMRDVKINKDVPEPSNLGTSCCHSSILGFSRRLRDHCLLFWISKR